MTTRNYVCIDDPDYDYHQCVESYFYTKFGCQYPWNSYKKLELPNCNNYTYIERIIKNMDHDYGYQRHQFGTSERFRRTKERCPPPCFSTRYDVKFETWAMHGSNISLQIAFADFKSTQRTQYLACDNTCIIGEIGGNLGLFLGGSILLGLDILMDCISFTVIFVQNKIWK